MSLLIWDKLVLLKDKLRVINSFSEFLNICFMLWVDHREWNTILHDSSFASLGLHFSVYCLLGQVLEDDYFVHVHLWLIFIYPCAHISFVFSLAVSLWLDVWVNLGDSTKSRTYDICHLFFLARNLINPCIDSRLWTFVIVSCIEVDALWLTSFRTALLLLKRG